MFFEAQVSYGYPISIFFKFFGWIVLLYFLGHIFWALISLFFTQYQTYHQFEKVLIELIISTVQSLTRIPARIPWAIILYHSSNTSSHQCLPTSRIVDLYYIYGTYGNTNKTIILWHHFTSYHTISLCINRWGKWEGHYLPPEAWFSPYDPCRRIFHLHCT